MVQNRSAHAEGSYLNCQTMLASESRNFLSRAMDHELGPIFLQYSRMQKWQMSGLLAGGFGYEMSWSGSSSHVGCKVQRIRLKKGKKKLEKLAKSMVSYRFSLKTNPLKKYILKSTLQGALACNRSPILAIQDHQSVQLRNSKKVETFCWSWWMMVNEWSFSGTNIKYPPVRGQFWSHSQLGYFGGLKMWNP